MTDNVVTFTPKNERINTALVFADSKVYTDAKVYGYYLYDLLECLSSHFWNNYQTAKTEIQQHHANEFDNYVKEIKQHIGFALEELHNIGDNKHAMIALKFEYDVNIKNLSNWFNEMGMPYRQANIIDIKNFIGVK